MATNTKNESKPSFFAKISRSVRDMRGEMKRVVWPSKKQVLNNTAVVLAFMLVASIVVGGFDSILTILRQLLFSIGA